MTISKCVPEMIDYAKHWKCPSCERRKPPGRMPRATMPYRPKRFGQIVGVDLKFVHDSAGNKYVALNILDFATIFNVLLLNACVHR